MKHRKTAALILILTALLLSSCAGRTDPQTTDITPSESQTETAAAPETTAAPETEAEAPAPEEAAEAINPVFSHEGGIYDGSISLELSIPEGAAGVSAIRYTTNGDEPNGKSPKYEKPVTLLAAKESTVVRAACFSSSGKQLGNTITQTYIKKCGRYSSGIIISISCDGDYLYDGKTGIMENPTGHGKAWERPAHIEFFDESGSRPINQDAGLRVFGGSSRGLPQKSFRLVARKTAYFDDIRYNGEGKFRYALLGDAKFPDGSPMVEFDRLVLRNGGNDSLQSTAADPKQMNLLRDGIVNNFASKTAEAVTVQASRPVTVILNGAYYGILDAKVDINDDYISDYYGITEKNNITVIKSELDTTRHCDKHSNGGSCRFDDVWFYYEVDSGEESELEALTSLLRKACNAKESDHDAVYKEIEAGIDLRCFMQYMALNLYVCNTDWPHNNVRLWRYNGEAVDGEPYTDGRWRFTLRDCDFAFGRYACEVLPEIYTEADTDTFERMLGNYYSGSYSYDESTGRYPDSLLLQGLGAFLLRNDSFRSEFEAYCRTLVSAENIALLRAEMESYAAQVRPLIEYHIKSQAGTIDGGYNANAWEKAVGHMYEWLDQRPDYFISFMEKSLRNFE